MAGLGGVARDGLVTLLVHQALQLGDRALLRPAILIAFLGYAASCFALFLDIGLPHRIWHAIVYWNHHSFPGIG